MEISIALIWFFAGLGCLILELLLPGFIVIFFAFGCFIAALCAWQMAISLTAQSWIFLISSLVLLLTLRKVGLKLFKGDIHGKSPDDYIDSKIGKQAVVTEKITPGYPGEIKLMGSFWRAVSNHSVDCGARVVIEKKASDDGLTFWVSPLD